MRHPPQREREGRAFPGCLAAACVLVGAVSWAGSVLWQWHIAVSNHAAMATLAGLLKWLSGAGRATLIGLLSNLGTSLIGAALFLFMVQRTLDHRRERQVEYGRLSQETNRLLERLRLGGDVATVALTDLRASGALRIGMLEGQQLRGVNLSKQDLSGAQLEGSDLSDSDLREALFVGAILRGARLERVQLGSADLSWADLTGAHVDDEVLRTASSLWRCTLPDGSTYDGKWNLPGEVTAAERYGVNLADPTERREFFSGGD